MLDSMKKARWEILNKANKRRDPRRGKYRMRHIQRAVFMCRQHKLVSPETIKAAGFNPNPKR